MHTHTYTQTALKEDGWFVKVWMDRWITRQWWKPFDYNVQGYQEITWAILHEYTLAHILLFTWRKLLVHTALGAIWGRGNPLIHRAREPHCLGWFDGIDLTGRFLHLSLWTCPAILPESDTTNGIKIAIQLTFCLLPWSSFRIQSIQHFQNWRECWWLWWWGHFRFWCRIFRLRSSRVHL